MKKPAKTPLEIIKEAYDKAGIIYVVRTQFSGEADWSYLFLTGKSRKSEFENANLEFLLRTEKFMEFEAGEIASY